MTLITAHKILIATAVVFFFGFGLWELRNYFAIGDPWAIVRGALYIVVAGGFGLYLCTLKKWVK